jgi:oxygen-independent coproporphyrinogen-3 oxidase
MEVATVLDIKNDICDIARLFDFEGSISVDASLQDDILNTIIEFEGKKYNFSDVLRADDLVERKSLRKRYIKKHVYDILQKTFNIFLPWGSLTGIRPARLFADTAAEMGEENAVKYFKEFYGVSGPKIELLREICASPKSKTPEKGALFYVGIPFCKGRCSYCSFFSADIDKNSGLIEQYIDCLLKEILAVKKIIKDNNINIYSVYIGGGTPSALPLFQLKRVLAEFDELPFKEFTVEAGRPDSIDAELLEALVACGVTRISINTQTANNNTLARIGRRHTFEDYVKAYKLARQYDFVINTDIIAGLPGENAEDFRNTADSIAALLPDNITVHTLSLKRGANLLIEGYKHSANVSEMVDYARSALNKYGYKAYYMYRQKNTAAHLENTGYCLYGKECLYNIDNINDRVSVFACGADAVSKKVSGNRIERRGNPKDIKTYCESFEKISESIKLFYGK